MTTKTAIATTIPFTGIQQYVETNVNDWARAVTVTANNMLKGKINCVGKFTLNASTVSTAIKFSAGDVGEETVLLYFPLTASAATEFGAGSIFMSSRSVANYTLGLTHASTADTDKVFAYVLLG